MKRFLIAASLGMAPITSAWASPSSSGPGLITFVHVHHDGQVIFEQGGVRGNAPGCATANNRWAFDGSTAAGQAKLSLVMSMYVSGRPVAVQGLGVCDVWGDTETVDFIAAPN